MSLTATAAPTLQLLRLNILTPPRHVIRNHPLAASGEHLCPRGSGLPHRCVAVPAISGRGTPSGCPAPAEERAAGDSLWVPRTDQRRILDLGGLDSGGHQLVPGAPPTIPERSPG